MHDLREVVAGGRAVQNSDAEVTTMRHLKTFGPAGASSSSPMAVVKGAVLLLLCVASDV